MRTGVLVATGMALVLLISRATLAEDKSENRPIDRRYGQILTMFVEKPLNERRKDLARMLIVYAMQSPKVAVVLSGEEMKWIGKTGDDRSLLLLAAFLGGNSYGQLLAGVKQNDRYSGLLTLFAVYRRLQAKDKTFKIPAVDELRKLHADGKLLAHLVELEKKKPTRISPETQKAIQKRLLKLLKKK